MSDSLRILIEELWAVTYINFDHQPQVALFSSDLAARKFYACAEHKYGVEGRVGIEPILPDAIIHDDEALDFFFHDELSKEERQAYEKAIQQEMETV